MQMSHNYISLALQGCIQLRQIETVCFGSWDGELMRAVPNCDCMKMQILRKELSPLGIVVPLVLVIDKACDVFEF